MLNLFLLVKLVFVVVGIVFRLFTFLAVGILSILTFRNLVFGLSVYVLLFSVLLLRRCRNLVSVLLKKESDGSGKQLEGDKVFFIFFAASLQQLYQLLICRIDLHITFQESLEGLKVDECLAH